MSTVGSVGGEGAEPPVSKPHLVLKLKPGWRLNEARRVFESAEGDQIDPMDLLPQGSTVVNTAPSMASKAPKDLSEAERDLARFVHIILPGMQSAATCLERMQALACVEECRLPPQISLP